MKYATLSAAAQGIAFDVYLNGKLQKGVLAADEEEGAIIRLKRHFNDKTGFCGMYEIVAGNVKIVTHSTKPRVLGSDLVEAADIAIRQAIAEYHAKRRNPRVR